jgi:SAM-dependent methyltransferase
MYAGVVLTTLATLLLELALTRIFSVVFYYHFAFLAISIALFGLGAGGIFSYAVAKWKRDFFWKLGLLGTAAAGLVIGALVFLLTREGKLGAGTLALVYLTSALPFFLSGTVVSLVIAETIERVNRVYCFDLMGAAGGCLLLIPLLEWVGGPGAVVISGAALAAAGAVWFHLAGNRRGRIVAAALALALTALAAGNAARPLIDVRYAKGKRLGQERFVKWNSFSRVALRGQAGSAMIFIDADASTWIPYYDFDHLSEPERQDLLGKGPGLPYLLRPGAKTLVIGAGGGSDLARALASGSRDVTGVEINPIIARTIMQGRFPELSQRLYQRPEVHLFVEDGRNFVRRTRERYQVLQATLVDTWAATAAGAFALSENSLYTTEAFGEYLSRLTRDGLLVFTRWGLEPPRESLRLVSLAAEALTRLGEQEPWRHVAVVREGNPQDLGGWGATDTVVIGRQPLGAADLARLREAVSRNGYEIVYLPDEPAQNPFNELLRSPDRQAFLGAYPYDVSPVSDNRPFFFYTVQPREVWAFLKNASHGGPDYQINRAVPLLFTLLAVSVGATALILALPRLVLGNRVPRAGGVMRSLWFFIFIGVGYILIQVALVQRFVLFLGHPTYALTVIIFSMLLASGLGSYFSRRIVGASGPRLAVALVLVAVLVAGAAAALERLPDAGVDWPLGVRFLASVALIAPAAFVMGIPFPAGLRRLEQRHAPSVRWAWSLNAAASVMGSVAAVALAIYVGLRETLLIGAAMYLCALAPLAAGAVTAEAVTQP